MKPLLLHLEAKALSNERAFVLNTGLGSPSFYLFQRFLFPCVINYFQILSIYASGTTTFLKLAVSRSHFLVQVAGFPVQNVQKLNRLLHYSVQNVQQPVQIQQHFVQIVEVPVQCTPVVEQNITGPVLIFVPSVQISKNSAQSFNSCVQIYHRPVQICQLSVRGNGKPVQGNDRSVRGNGSFTWDDRPFRSLISFLS